MRVNFWGICFPLALLAILYDDVLGIEAFTPWTVLIAALFMSIGLTLIFPHKTNVQTAQSNAAAWEQHTVYDDFARISAKFSETVKCVGSRNLQGVEITSSFAGLKLYFNNAQLASGQAVVNVNSRFSGIELYVPRGWQVVNNIRCTAAGLDERRFTNFAKTNAALIIKGTASFSGITVIYV
jgi:predicted membrane protein